MLLPRIASCFFTALFLNVHLSFCAVITIITIRPKMSLLPVAYGEEVEMGG